MEIKKKNLRIITKEILLVKIFMPRYRTSQSLYEYHINMMEVRNQGVIKGQKPPNIDKAQDLNDHGNAADDLHIVG